MQSEDTTPPDAGQDGVDLFAVPALPYERTRQIWRSRLGTKEKAVLTCIADHLSADGRPCWPSLTTLEEMTSLSESTTRRTIRTLERVGALQTRTVTGQSSQYRIAFGLLSSVQMPTPVSVQGVSACRGCQPDGGVSLTGEGGQPDGGGGSERPPKQTIEVDQEADHSNAGASATPPPPVENPAESQPPAEDGVDPLSLPFWEGRWRLPLPVGKPLADAGLQTWGDIAAYSRDALKMLAGYERNVQASLDLVETHLLKAADAHLRPTGYAGAGGASGGSVAARIDVERAAAVDWGTLDTAVRRWGYMRPPRPSNQSPPWLFGDDAATHERILSVMARAGLDWRGVCLAGEYEAETQRKRFTLAWPGAEVAA